MSPTALLAAALAAVFAAFGGAKLVAVPSMRARAAHVGFGVAAYRRIGALEVAGAAGLLLRAWLPLVGVLAAAGLLLLMAGAVVTHVRAKDEIKDVVPALVLAMLLAVLLALQP